MAEYIEREEVYKNACKGCKNRGIEVGSCFSEELCEVLILAFVNAPSADVAQVRHGRWEPSGSCEHRINRKRNTDKWTTYKCSECGFSNGRRFRDNFCPNCGAKMDGGAENG